MNDLTLKFKEIQEKFLLAVQNDLPIVVGKTAADFYKQSFHNEGFTNQSLVPWKDVKRRNDPRVKGARSTRAILTGDTGDLGESIKYRSEPGKAVIYSDKKYAQAHNEGTTTAGRGNRTVIPKRQFMGPSKVMDDIIEKEIRRKLGNIFK